MYLRLAFSVAVNMEPDILLADEVLAVGDLAFQERCLQRVEEAGQEGLTVVFVSHDLAAVRRLCNRVIWINDGRIVRDGRTDDVVSAYEEATWSVIAGNEGGGSHVNDYGEIVHTRLLGSDGAELGSVRVSDDLTVRVMLRIDQPGLGFRCILVFAADGVDAFRTVQPLIRVAERSGVYQADVRIPAHLLSDTVYTVKTGIWFSIDGAERRDAALVRHNSLTFRVYDDGGGEGSARGSYGGPLRGVLRPRLDWQVEPAVTERRLARPA
jgi:lipopolysaccharide transport system ATP-binding protein